MDLWKILVDAVPSYGIAMAVLWMLWTVLKRFLDIFSKIEDSLALLEEAFRIQTDAMRALSERQTVALIELTRVVNALRDELLGFMLEQD